MRRFVNIFALILIIAISSAHAQQDRDWVLLGEQAVASKVNQDVINVGQTEAWFQDRWYRVLHVVPERMDIQLITIRIIYLNGYTEDISVDWTVRRGEQYAIDLGDDRSYFKRFEIIYRARPDLRGEPLIKLYAEPSSRVGGFRDR